MYEYRVKKNGRTIDFVVMQSKIAYIKLQNILFDEGYGRVTVTLERMF